MHRRSHTMQTIATSSASTAENKLDAAHIGECVHQVIEATGEQPQGHLTLLVCKPAGTVISGPGRGHIEFRLDRPSQPPILFAATLDGQQGSRRRYNGLTMDEMEAAAREQTPRQHACMASYEELWRFACLVVQRLNVNTLDICHVR